MGITGYIVVILLGLLIIASGLALRRLRIIRDGGVHVAYRVRGGAPEPGAEPDAGGWRLGIGHYRGEKFRWYRVLGLTTRPDRVISRAGLEIVRRREPTAAEAYAMPAEATVLACRAETGDVELAMGVDTVTGFLSWLESSPPGRDVKRAW